MAVLIALFSLVPLAYVIVMTAATGWDTAVSLIVRPRVGELLLNTVLLTVVTVPLCLVLGVGGAWLVERTTLVGRKWWAVLLAAPLAIPAFVNSYAWVSAVPSLGGLWSGVLIATLSYFPLVYIPAAATLSRLDPAIEQSAASLGLGAWRAFFRVVLPQLRIAMTGGGLLVALHLLAEYGAFAMIRFDTFTTAIMVQYQSTFNGTAGNMLASVLVFLCLILLLVEVRSRGSARYARIGSGAQARALRLPLHAYQVPAQLSLIALTGLAFGLPLTFVLRWIFAGGPEVWAAEEFMPALLQTLAYGLGAAVVTTLVAFPMAYLAVRRPGWFSKSLELSNYITSSMPGIVVGLAFVTVSIRMLPSMYQTSGLLIAAYVLLFLPAGPGEHPLRAVPGAEGTRRGRPGAWQAAPAGLPPRHAAPDGPRRGRRRCPGVPGDRQRAHGHPAALAQRNPHARHRVLEQEQRDRLRRRRPVCAADDPDLGAHDLPPFPAVQESSRTVTDIHPSREAPSRLPEPRIAASVATSTNSHLEIDAVTKNFGSQAVLKGVNLSVARGGTTAIVGPSGSGKTTLLRLIAGFEHPDTGSISLNGTKVAGENAWVPAHKRHVGYVAQDGALFPHLTVGQNISFGLDAAKLPGGRRGVKARVGELLEMVSLDPAMAKRRPHQLSGGQQQRVALARALAREPELMLLDEPFSALDAGLRVATRRAVGQVLKDAGVTTILVTHDQAEALSFADQVAVMRGGKLAQIGNPFVVYTRPADRATAEFLGDAVILDAWMEGSLATCSLGGIPVRRPPAQGRVQLMLRPEQIRISEDGPIRGTVVDTDYFGPETTVRLQLPVPPVLAAGAIPDHRYPGGGEIITIRHWNASIARPGTELRLRVVGEAVAFPVDEQPAQ